MAGRLIGGTLDVIAMLCGSAYGDFPGFAVHAGEVLEQRRRGSGLELLWRQHSGYAQVGQTLRVVGLVVGEGHHGSSGSNSSAWLNAVAPELAIASSGFRNSYHHPTEAVQTRLRAHGIKVYRTDTQGSVGVLLDGSLTVLPRAGPRFWWQRKPFDTADRKRFTEK